MAAEKKINYIVYDLETGGLSSEKHAVTEIAMIALDGQTLEEIGRYTTFIKPYDDTLGYSNEALNVTGITMEMIQSGLDAKVAVKEICEFITSHGKGAIHKPILCGHNIKKFDNPFLARLLLHARKDLYKIVSPEFIDTMWWSRIRTPVNSDDYGKHNLNDACVRGGVEIIDAHRAMNDTAANASLLIKFIKSLRGAGEAINQIQKHNYKEPFRF